MFQILILQTKSHWKLYLSGFLKNIEDLCLEPMLTFFFLFRASVASVVLWVLVSSGLYIILHSLQLLGLTQFPASNAFERNICNVLLSALDHSGDEFVFSLCSRLRLLNSTGRVINLLKCLYTPGV